jgi:hypothetical protein
MNKRLPRKSFIVLMFGDPYPKSLHQLKVEAMRRRGIVSVAYNQDNQYMSSPIPVRHIHTCNVKTEALEGRRIQINRQ